MKSHWTRLGLITVMGLISFGSYSQQPAATASQSPADAPIRINPGTLVQVEMMTDVDAKKAHVGDVFRARLWEAVRSGEQIILPQKTILVGHVVEVQPRTKSSPESKMTIAFDKAALKDGSELPLRGVVERVQLSAIAAATAADVNARSYNPGLVPGSTTNVAMPTQVPLPGEGGDRNQLATSGPTNIRDATIGIQNDPVRALTVLIGTKSDVKLKRFATLDLRITHAGE